MAVALATVAALAALAVVLLLRRRGARPEDLVPRRFDPSPAGLKHLAASVSDLSDLGLHLGAARRPGRKPRLGMLLGLR
jgi:hypothetical protein